MIEIAMRMPDEKTWILRSDTTANGGLTESFALSAPDGHQLSNLGSDDRHRVF